MWEKCAAKTIGHRSECYWSFSFQGPDPEESGQQREACLHISRPRATPQGLWYNYLLALALRGHIKRFLFLFITCHPPLWQGTGPRARSTQTSESWCGHYCHPRGGRAGCGWGERNMTGGLEWWPLSTLPLHPWAGDQIAETMKRLKMLLVPTWKTLEQEWKKVHFLRLQASGGGDEGSLTLPVLISLGKVGYPSL